MHWYNSPDTQKGVSQVEEMWRGHNSAGHTVLAEMHREADRLAETSATSLDCIKRNYLRSNVLRTVIINWKGPC